MRGKSRGGSQRAAAAALAALCALAPAACKQRAAPLAPAITAPTPATHTGFPIAAGTHAVDCASCHGAADSFRQFDCTGCHGHDRALTDRLHPTVAGYSYAPTSCLSCHADGSRQPFDHPGITAGCASCHDVSAPFAALPFTPSGGGQFTHPAMGGNDCAACHTTASWHGSGAPAAAVADLARAVLVDALVPAYAGASIISLAPRAETLPMPMLHGSPQVPASAGCTDCHADASSGSFYPGVFHASLAALGVAQPTACSDCHAASAPAGFVGPTATDPARTPPSPEMKHDAVAWTAGKQGTAALVTQDCGLCHLAPAQLAANAWAVGRSGAPPAKFHASLSAQPASCIDCHANSRPAGVLSAPAVALPAGVSFDHASSAALADCAACHAGSTSSWSGGKLHLAGSANPTSCLPCHAGERPTSTDGWKSTTYAQSPFDYGTNANGVAHGNGLDCATCHAGPGTGAWGGTQTWAGGAFGHPAGAITTCIACHAAQRPDLNGVAPAQIPDPAGQPFDHSINGTGDCVGCHQATVVRGSYARYSPIPGSDWRGGQGYPGGVLVSSPNYSITVTQTTLARNGSGFITGMTQSSATYPNAMLHTSLEVPPQMRPDPNDTVTCTFCHANDGAGHVTSLANGAFHASVTNWTGPGAPLAQPAACYDCHAPVLPNQIVERKDASGHLQDILPMDHGASFTPAIAGGAAGGPSVATFGELECANCHTDPGDLSATAPGKWQNGVFHANAKRLGIAPTDCTQCHYPLMADTAKSDVPTGVFAMKHASAQVPTQQCASCHATALANSTKTPVASTLWQTGALHANVAAQPTLCLDCHASGAPASATQSGVSYQLPEGGTTSNGAQWMNHASSDVASKDCAVCHVADATPVNGAWSKTSSFHGNAAATSCTVCHGLANGVGASAPGTNNNLPAGLIDSKTLTSASSDSTTGVPAGTHDQISHADVNASGRDCNACHTQVGPSSTPGVAGAEWAQASFHANFTAVTPLLMNGTTGRCSNCHLNVKPAAGFSVDHSAFTAAPGTQDCAGCHTWPGTGNASAPNWLGAAGAPATVTLKGWSSGSAITSSTVTFAHPSASSYTSCAQCHPNGSNATLIDYNHDGLTSNVTVNGTPVTTNLGTSIYDASANPTFCVHCHQSNSPWISKTGLSSTITANTTTGSTTVTTASTAALTAGMTISGSGIPSTTTTNRNFTATLTAGSTSFTTSAAQSFTAGTPISGTGIPAGDTIASRVSSTSFTLASPATQSGTFTLTAAVTTSVTVTIRSIASGTSFVISTAANATVGGSTLNVTHFRITQATVGQHNGSTSSEDCTSCHYKNGSIAALTPPTPGTFASGNITGN